jgi:serine/threonine protein phosphatase 1
LQFSRLFKRQKIELPTAISTAGRVIYAIGDIHGRLDLLDELFPIITVDAETFDEEAQFVFLGDYVDRGHQSKETIGRLIEIKAAGRARFLMGNHEQTLLAFTESSEFGATWSSFGGAETLRSYGVTAPAGADPEAWERTRLAFLSALPDTHLAFLNELELSFELGDFFFAHAGVRPKVPLDEQLSDDLLWIRTPFLDSEQPASKIVVHGHTPAETPYSGAWRIGVDTGAYATGVLTAVRLCGDDRAFLQTGAAWDQPSTADAVGKSNANF